MLLCSYLCVFFRFVQEHAVIFCLSEHTELVMLLEWWSGTECTLYTDQATVDMFGKEHVIIILNHNFEIDFLCGWTMCERYGVLGVSYVTRRGRCERWICSDLSFCPFFVFCFQSSKVLAKHELLKVPLIGWTWYFLEIVFCKRKWEEDRETVFSGLNSLKDYPEYMWVSNVLTNEGALLT